MKCLSCGTLSFTDRLIGGTGTGTISLTGNIMVGACPKCGGDCQVVDGQYELTGGVVTAFRALSRTSLEGMRDTLRASQRGDITPDAATAEVAAISPEVAAIIDAFQNQRQWTSPVIVTVLISIVTALLTWMALHPDKTLTEADHEALQHDVRQAIEQAQPAPSPRPPSASPPVSKPKPPSASTKPKRKKRPPKTHGKNKKRKRR